MESSVLAARALGLGRADAASAVGPAAAVLNSLVSDRGQSICSLGSTFGTAPVISLRVWELMCVRASSAMVLVLIW
jgi:hypothetical protein